MAKNFVPNLARKLFGAKLNAMHVFLYMKQKSGTYRAHEAQEVRTRHQERAQCASNMSSPSQLLINDVNIKLLVLTEVLKR